MHKTIQLLLFGLVIFFTSCNPKVITSLDEDYTAYHNKYVHDREIFQGQGKTVTIPLEFDSTTQKSDITIALNKALDTKPIKVIPPVESKIVDGWRIQIYRGRSREMASQARQESYELFSNMTPYIFYRSPTYRVRVGDFLERYECKPYLKAFKRKFPEAVIVRDKITLIVYDAERRR